MQDSRTSSNFSLVEKLKARKNLNLEERIFMCFVCDRIKETKVGNNPFLVKELETGYVVIGDYQHFKVNITVRRSR